MCIALHAYGAGNELCTCGTSHWPFGGCPGVSFEVTFCCKEWQHGTRLVIRTLGLHLTSSRCRRTGQSCLATWSMPVCSPVLMPLTHAYVSTVAEEHTAAAQTDSAAAVAARALFMWHML